MTWEGWAVVAIVATMIVILARDAAPTEAVVLGALVALAALSPFTDRLLSPAELARGFGNEALVVIGVLLVIGAGLTETGGVAVLVERLLGRPRGVAAAQVRMLAPVVGLSALLNNTTVVAVFIPIVRDWCSRGRLNPAKLYLPLSYGAILGGVCTLVGTSTNLTVQGLLQQAGLPVMGMFSITVIGLPASVIGLTFLVLASRWLLPERRSSQEAHADPREYTVEMIVQPESALVGRTIESAGLRHLEGLYLAHIERNGATLVAVGPEERLQGNDRLVFVGVVSSVLELQRIRGLVPATNQVFKLTGQRPDRCLIEAVISPSCPLIGRSVREGHFRSRYDAAIIAIHRNGERLVTKIGDIVLRAGDTLLLESLPGFLSAHRDSRDFFLVSPLPESEPRRYHKAPVALAILLAMIIVVGAETVTRVQLLPAALVAATLMIVTGCLSLDQALRSIDWRLLITIGASFGIGRAFDTSGASAALATLIAQPLEPLGPLAALASIYLLTLILTETMSNNAAAVLAFPLARGLADEMSVSFMPFAIAIAMAASAGFAMPLGYQTHLMVFGPGGYRTSDFLRLGVPMDVVVMLVTVLLTPLFFPF